ncbi:hypothetical protein ACHAQD_002500 [Fusarium lateritium]
MRGEEARLDPTILPVVIQLGNQVDDTPLLKNKGVNSILWHNYPGQDGGTALMDIVTGRKSPAGRLPVTQYPSSYAKAVGMTEMDLRPSKSNPGIKYRWYSKAVFPYGFGMHYTTFKAKFKSPEMKLDIQKLLDSCGATYADTCPHPSIQVIVKNTALFIKDEIDPKPYPLETLVAYARSHDIAPGTTGSQSSVDAR